jgi:predicted DNA-binding transcriptional regulator YafY
MHYACCTSSIGPRCPHRAEPSDDRATVELATHTADIRLVIVAAIVDDEPLAVVHYNHTTGRTTLRYVVPCAIERCKNGSTIVRVYDLQNKAPRSFRLENIRNAGPAF